MQNDGNRDLGGMVVAALLIIIGIVVLWDTTNMVDSDSYVFPVTVALLMIGLCVYYICWSFLKTPAGEPKRSLPGSIPRRIGLVAAMLGCAIIMPYTGFLIAGLLVFAAITVTAMYERWTSRRLIIYPIICIAVVCGFYLLFAKALMVPLPEAPFL